MATVSMPSDKRRRSADITTNTTLTAADQGIVQVIRSSSAFVTLPSTAASLTFTFRVGGGVVTSGPQGAAGSAVVLNISPAAADGIGGLGLTTVINKDLIYTGGAVGEEFTLTASGTAGTAAWYITDAPATTGTFSKEA
jgi:hypothetical protein